MRRTDGSARFAYVTLLMLNDSYLPGVLMLAYALRQQNTGGDLVCLVSSEISERSRQALGCFYDWVIAVDKIHIPYGCSQKRQHTPFVLTRLNALRLGADGDLGCAYEKIILLDADLLPLRYYDHLFTLPAPAGVMNEHKKFFVECDDQGRYLLPQEFDRWRWHQEYDSICPHGKQIPKWLTDRVRRDPLNMGIHGALFVLEPNMDEFRDIVSELCRPDMCRYIGETYAWPDMQYLTVRWSGAWTNVDLRFSGFKGYPTLSVLHGTHYAGMKPWQIDRSKTFRRWMRYEDFRYWFWTFGRMMCCGDAKLQAHSQLQRLWHRIQLAQEK